MKHKYIIPLVLCGVLIISAMPANAETVYPTNDAQSHLSNANSVGWIMSIFQDTGHNYKSTQTVSWYDFKNIDYQYAPRQTVHSYYYMNTNDGWKDKPNVLGYGDSYGQTISAYPNLNDLTLSRYHNYQARGQSTSTITSS